MYGYGLDDAVPEWSVVPTDADNTGYERDWQVRGSVLPTALGTSSDFSSVRHFFLFATPLPLNTLTESATI